MCMWVCACASVFVCTVCMHSMHTGVCVSVCVPVHTYIELNVFWLSTHTNYTYICTLYASVKLMYS